MNIEHPLARYLPALRSLWKEAFGDTDEFLDLFFGTAFAPERSLCAVENGEAQAALYWFDCEYGGGKLAYVYAVATAKKHRGKGLCRALTDRLQSVLSEGGYAGSVLVPGGGELFSLYERLGYRVCSSVSEFECTAADGGADLRLISADEYAALRKEFLPEGGVVQDGESLRFLDRQAEFCAGEGFLLAFRREGEKLHGIELLGDVSLAPFVTAFLGCRKGKFCTPGKDIPFAMFRPVEKEKTPPSYFGLAFD